MSLKQGDLDGLCGLYAIMNACKVLFPDLGVPIEYDLLDFFRDNINDSDFKNLYFNGMGDEFLEKLLDQIIPYIQQKYGNEITCHRMTDITRKDTYFDKMDLFFNDQFPNCEIAAIILVSGRINHWTCVESVNENYLNLVDSCGIKTISYAQATVGNDLRKSCLKPRAVYGLVRHYLDD